MLELFGSNISCGIRELIDVGRATEAEFDRVMAMPHCGIVLASLTTEQTAGIALLKKKGFRQVGRPILNPNSGNMILLFMKRFPTRKPKKSATRR